MINHGKLSIDTNDPSSQVIKPPISISANISQLTLIPDSTPNLKKSTRFYVILKLLILVSSISLVSWVSTTSRHSLTNRSTESCLIHTWIVVCSLCIVCLYLLYSSVFRDIAFLLNPSKSLRNSSPLLRTYNGIVLMAIMGSFVGVYLIPSDAIYSSLFDTVWAFSISSSISENDCNSASYIIFLLVLQWDSLVLTIYLLVSKCKWPVDKYSTNTSVISDLHEYNDTNKLLQSSKPKKWQFDWNKLNTPIGNEQCGNEQGAHAFIICCHNSTEKLANTCAAILNVAEPWCIFIADNGSSPEEIKTTEQMCHLITIQYAKSHPEYDGPGINFGCITEASKTVAQFATTFTLLSYPKKIAYVTLIDDDTTLPPTFSVDAVMQTFQDTNIACIAYPLVASNVQPTRILSLCQNVEYITAGFIRSTQSDIATTVFASGALSTWKIGMLLEVLLRHDSMHNGEDLQMGLIVHSLAGQRYILEDKYHQIQPYKVHVASSVLCATDVVSCWVHASDFRSCCPSFAKKHCSCGEPSLFKQRAISWEISRHRFFFKWLKPVFNCRNVCTSRGFCIRSLVIYDAILIINDWITLAVLIWIFISLQNIWHIIQGLLITWAIFLIVHSSFNFILNPMNLNFSVETIVLYPFIYKLPLLLIKYYAMFYNILYYVPCIKNKPILSERMTKQKFAKMIASGYDSSISHIGYKKRMNAKTNVNIITPTPINSNILPARLDLSPALSAYHLGVKIQNSPVDHDDISISIYKEPVQVNPKLIDYSKDNFTPSKQLKFFWNNFTE